MKLIVETTDTSMLLDLGTRPAQEVPYNRPAVVQKTHLISQRIGSGQLKVLAEDVPACACDKAFAEALKGAEGDVALAVDAYLAEIEPKEEAPKKAESKGKKKDADK